MFVIYHKHVSDRLQNILTPPVAIKELFNQCVSNRMEGFRVLLKDFPYLNLVEYTLVPVISCILLLLSNGYQGQVV